MAHTKGRTVSSTKTSGQLGMGDAVIVNADVRDPDLGIGIGGWHGTIIDVSAAAGTVCIAWDSATLEAMPPTVIDHCEREGLAWDHAERLGAAVTHLAAPARPPRDDGGQRFTGRTAKPGG